ncbi:hypothetical protein GCM10009628_30200 [Paeniglutamicibacter kerguelensis]
MLGSAATHVLTAPQTGGILADPQEPKGPWGHAHLPIHCPAAESCDAYIIRFYESGKQEAP